MESKQARTEAIQQPQARKFYRWAYIMIPLPMALGLALAAYAYTTKDQRRVCYCTTASSSAAYTALPQHDGGISQHYQTSVAECMQLDEEVDDGDGREHGRVRWIVCIGTRCGYQWQELLAVDQNT